LLDTHALLWWLSDDLRLSRPARRAIADPANQLTVSAADGYEIACASRPNLGAKHPVSREKRQPPQCELQVAKFKDALKNSENSEYEQPIRIVSGRR
jgi:PIN domain nuclease of toxin-antitoxin system